MTCPVPALLMTIPADGLVVLGTVSRLVIWLSHRTSLKNRRKR